LKQNSVKLIKGNGINSFASSCHFDSYYQEINEKSENDGLIWPK